MMDLIVMSVVAMMVFGYFCVMYRYRNQLDAQLDEQYQREQYAERFL